MRIKFMYIYRAQNKHDYYNFGLEILEYCEVSELLIREKYFIKFLKPEYNTAQNPTALMTGRAHSDETRKKNV